MDWNMVSSILSGLIVTIPLVIKLVEYVQKAIKERNWNRLLSLVMDYMKTAEAKFETGAERKEWVMAMVQSSASSINYDVDMVVVSEMIDALCDMSNVVNAPVER